jgi:hypothetical protein
MPDGLVVDRLPLGYANERWRLTFVCSGVDFRRGHPSRAILFSEEFAERVSITAVTGGDFVYAGGGGHGSGSEQDRHLRFSAEGAETIRVSYLCEGQVVASEVLDLG